MNVISMRRFLACMGVSCLLGAVFGLLGGLMDWSNGVAFAVLAVAGTITGAVTLHEKPSNGLNLLVSPWRRTRHRI
jgi:uncharacterized membrane protein YfcA